MTKRQLKTIVSLYKEGVSTKVCIAAILELMGDNESALIKGEAIHQFFEEVVKLNKGEN